MIDKPIIFQAIQHVGKILDVDSKFEQPRKRQNFHISQDVKFQACQGNKNIHYSQKYVHIKLCAYQYYLSFVLKVIQNANRKNNWQQIIISKKMGSEVPKIIKTTNPVQKGILVSENSSQKLYRSENGQFYEMLRIQNYGFKDFLDKFTYRIANHHENVINAYFIEDVKNNFGCLVEGIYNVVIDAIRSRLSEHHKIENIVLVNLFKSSLKGFQMLYNWVGLFEVKDTMIGFSYNNTIKVWLNSKFQLNSLENQPIIYQNVPQADKQSKMMNNILQLINAKSQTQEIWANFLRWWRQKKIKSFSDAICLIQNYIENNNISKSLVFVNEKDNRSSMYTVANNNQFKQSNVVKQHSSKAQSDLANSVVSKNKDIFQLPNESRSISQSQQIRQPGFTNLRTRTIHPHPNQIVPHHQVHSMNQQFQKHPQPKGQPVSQPMNRFAAPSNCPPENRIHPSSSTINFLVGSGNYVPAVNKIPPMPMILRSKEQKAKIQLEIRNKQKVPNLQIDFTVNKSNLVNSVSLDDRRFITQNRPRNNIERSFFIVKTNNVGSQLNKPRQDLICPPNLVYSVQPLKKFPEPRRAAQIIQNIKSSPKKQKAEDFSNNDKQRLQKLIKLNQAIYDDENLDQENRKQFSNNRNSNERIPGKIKHKTYQIIKKSKTQLPIEIQSNLQIVGTHNEESPKPKEQINYKVWKQDQQKFEEMREVHKQQNELSQTPSFKALGEASQLEKQYKLAEKTEQEMKKSQHRVQTLQNNLTNSMKMLDSIQKRMEMSKFSRMSRTSSDLTSSISYRDLNNLLKSVRRKKND